MSQVDGLTEAGSKTPKAAAIASFVFSVLTLANSGLLRSAVPRIRHLHALGHDQELQLDQFGVQPRRFPLKGLELVPRGGTFRITVFLRLTGEPLARASSFSVVLYNTGVLA